MLVMSKSDCANASVEEINLLRGWPSTTLFPSAAINDSASAILEDLSAASSALVYGPSLGSLAFRKSLAEWLSTSYYENITSIDSSRIAVSGGASANLNTILTRYSDPSYTQYIWMIEPTYHLACRIFQDGGFTGQLRGVPEDNEGVDLAFLRAGLEAAEQEKGRHYKPAKSVEMGYEKIYRHFIYCVPTFSNPSGKTMSNSHREKLVKLARDFDALLVCDDVYDFLRWPTDLSIPLSTDLGPLPPRLADIDRSLGGTSTYGNAVSNGSFSKIVAPGTRVGWSEGTDAFIRNLGRSGVNMSGGAPSYLMSTFVENIISSGALTKHLNNVLVPTYSSRYHGMIAAIKSELLPLGVQVAIGNPAFSVSKSNAKTSISGGFFTSLNIPHHLPPTSILAAEALKNHKLRIGYGKMFEVVGDEGSAERSKLEGGFAHSIRICWAWHTEEEILEGIRRLGLAVKELSDSRS